MEELEQKIKKQSAFYMQEVEKYKNNIVNLFLDKLNSLSEYEVTIINKNEIRVCLDNNKELVVFNNGDMFIAFKSYMYRLNQNNKSLFNTLIEYYNNKKDFEAYSECYKDFFKKITQEVQNDTRG